MKNSKEAKYYIMYPNFKKFLSNLENAINLNVFKPISAGFKKQTNEKIHTLIIKFESGSPNFESLKKYINEINKLYMLKETGILLKFIENKAEYHLMANEKPILNIVQNSIRKIINVAE